MASDAQGNVQCLIAEQIIEALGLEYLNGEGCWIRLLWRTEHANAIYALLTPNDFSAMHRLVEDEAWTFVAGAAAEILVLHTDGTHEVVHLGGDPSAGQVAHHRIPAHTWQGTVPLGEWTLVTCVLAPPFSGIELTDAASDFSGWPDAESAIKRRMR